MAGHVELGPHPPAGSCALFSLKEHRCCRREPGIMAGILGRRLKGIAHAAHLIGTALTSQNRHGSRGQEPAPQRYLNAVDIKGKMGS